MSETTITIWHDCYNASLRGLITPASFAHPAKMARRLCERILEHGQARGYWKPGDLLLDPFAGVFTTGLLGAYRGYRVIGVELEPKFFALANDNIALNAPKLAALGCTLRLPKGHPLPLLLPGASRRRVDRVVGAGLIPASSTPAGAISSPPYADSEQDYQEGWKRFHANHTPLHRNDIQRQASYGDTTGQLSELPPGDLPAIVGSISSPPYAQSVHDGNGIDPAKLTGNPTGPNSQALNDGYGNAPGQLGALPPGNPDAVTGALTSPPWQKTVEGGLTNFKDPESFAQQMTDRDGTGQRHGTTFKSRLAQIERESQKTYGNSEGQVGAESGDTYWAAVAAIYTQLFHLLPSGGALALVVKDYVKNKQRVPLCDQTTALLQAIGFTIPERIYAMLVEEHITPGLFGPISKKTSRKSFFRRLAEKKGSPEINWEEVIWAIKP